jgi:hypothetical protein
VTRRTAEHRPPQSIKVTVTVRSVLDGFGTLMRPFLFHLFHRLPCLCFGYVLLRITNIIIGGTTDKSVSL